MTMTLWDNASGAIGELGTDLIKAEWRSGTPVAGELAIRGDSLFVAYLMDCAYRSLTIVATDSGHMNGRYRVRRHTYTYLGGEWASLTDVFRTDE